MSASKRRVLRPFSLAAVRAINAEIVDFPSDNIAEVTIKLLISVSLEPFLIFKISLLNSVKNGESELKVEIIEKLFCKLIIL